MVGYSQKIPVIDDNLKYNAQESAFFLNGQFTSQVSLSALDPSLIDSVHVVKENIQVGGTTYHGQVYIKSKSDYTPDLVTLTTLKEEYTDLKTNHVVFMINNQIIKDDPDKCLVDKNYILQIRVDNIEREGIGFVKVLTKTKENIRKAKEIRIRG